MFSAGIKRKESLTTAGEPREDCVLLSVYLKGKGNRKKMIMYVN